LKDIFHPDDGSAIIPECFGILDAVGSDIALEQTSCNLGKSLKLRRQDNRVGTKMMVVVIKNPTKTLIETKLERSVPKKPLTKEQ